VNADRLRAWFVPGRREVGRLGAIDEEAVMTVLLVVATVFILVLVDLLVRRRHAGIECS
jgi:hypothetical protein